MLLDRVIRREKGDGGGKMRSDADIDIPGYGDVCKPAGSIGIRAVNSEISGQCVSTPYISSFNFGDVARASTRVLVISRPETPAGISMVAGSITLPVAFHAWREWPDNRVSKKSNWSTPF